MRIDGEEVEEEEEREEEEEEERVAAGPLDWSGGQGSPRLEPFTRPPDLGGVLFCGSVYYIWEGDILER